MKESNQSTIARLLATENISVVQDNVHTASFDVKNRVLTLPVWSEIEKYVEDHLVGHEVGHALYTPLDGWHDAVCDNGPAFKSFLNVVEDARIEKLIQRKYPGLRSSFIRSYRKLLADGFFGANLDQINDMGLIDRINTYFKCGQSAGVKFSTDEQQWLPRIDSLETWDEVVSLTEELFAFCKEQAEQQRQQEMEQAQDGDDDIEDDFEEDPEDEDEDEWGDPSPDFGEEDGEEQPDQERDAFDELFDDSEVEQENNHHGRSAGQGPIDEPKSETDKNLRQAIDREINTNFGGGVENYILSEFDSKDRFFSYKDVLADMRHEKYIDASDDDWRYDPTFEYKENRQREYAETLKFGKKLYDSWYQRNRKSISIMVKEFEMRKSAAAYQRASISKTGVIDTVKMNNYRISDDIFKKVTILPEGKNHGFIMVLDLSGSMVDCLYFVTQQVLLMTHFCRQIGVPFRVYGFVDYLGGSYDEVSDDRDPMDLRIASDLKMIEIFNERMSKADLVEIASALLASTTRYGAWRAIQKDVPDINVSEGRFISIPRVFALGGTPLDSSIVALIPVALKFRQQHRLDVLNTIFLTDGASCPLSSGNGWIRGTMRNLTTIRSKINNKTYKFRQLPRRMMQGTEVLMNIYKDITGSVNLGYYVASGGKQVFRHEAENLQGSSIPDFGDKWKDIKNSHMSLNVEGYDEFFLVPASALRRVESKMDTVDSGASKAKLRSAFKSSGLGNKTNRKMLIDIVKRVA